MRNKGVPGFPANGFPVGSGRQVTDLYPNQRIALYKGVVPAHMWAAYPCPCGVTAVLVLECAVNDVNFLAACMCVRLEALTGGPVHQCHLLTCVFV